MKREWFYSKNGSKNGPITAAELKALAQAGNLTPDDFVWKEGMAAWLPAGKVKGLFKINYWTEPPPLSQRDEPRSPSDPFDFETDEPEDESEEKPSSQRKRYGRKRKDLGLWRFGVVYVAVVLTSILIMIVTAAYQKNNEQRTWDRMIGFEVMLLFLAAIAICVVPLAAGHVWKNHSHHVGHWGKRELRVYIPTNAIGWVGYYFAVWLAIGCFILLILAAVMVLAMSSTRVCPYCRRDTPSWMPSCSHCNMKLP